MMPYGCSWNLKYPRPPHTHTFNFLSVACAFFVEAMESTGGQLLLVEVGQRGGPVKLILVCASAL